MNSATERWMWCLFLLGPHIFHPRWIWTPVLQDLDCGLRSPGYGASVVHFLLPGCSSWPKGSSVEPGVKIKVSSDAVHYHYHLLSPEVCMQSLPALLANWECDAFVKNTSRTSSSLAFLFLFSSWDLKNKTGGKGIQKSFYTSYSLKLWNWWFMPGLSFSWRILQVVVYCLFFTCCHGQTGE